MIKTLILCEIIRLKGRYSICLCLNPTTDYFIKVSSSQSNYIIYLVIITVVGGEVG